VTRGTTEVPPELFGVGIPVDPGETTVHAEAPDHLPFEQTVTIPPQAGRSEVVVTSLPPLSSSSPQGGPAGPGPHDDRDDAGGLGTLGIAGIVIGGVGLAGLGASAIVMLSAKSSYDDAVAACPDATCPSEALRGDVDDARGTGDVGTAVFLGGAALTAVGATLLVVDLASASPREHASRRAHLAFTPSSVVISGTY
jgi:hypothetical protein